jgi:FkbM family methyltransferase
MTPWIQGHRTWEPEETAFFERVLQPGMRVVDCGANVGYFTLLASRLVGAEGHVLAVEPEPRNLALLRANLWRNACTNATVAPVASYSYTGYVAFDASSANHGDFRVAAGDAVRGRAPLLVPCARLDDLLPDAAVDVLKLDVQGSEQYTVLGMHGLLERSPGLLGLIELAPWLVRETGDDPLAVLSLYLSLGLTLSLLRPDGSWVEAEPAAILRACDEAEGGFVNLVVERGR